MDAGSLGAQLVSGHWYRVAGVAPRLRDHLRMHAHRYRDQPWYVVEDRLSGKFHRFDQQAWRIMSLLDGSHSLESIWQKLASEADEATLSQEDILALLGQLHALDLLATDTLPDLAELGERDRRQSRQKVLAKYMNPLALRIPLVDPDRFLAKLVAWLKPVLNRWGALAWGLWVVPAIVLAASHWSELTNNVGERLLAMDNLLLLAVLFPLVKALHELGHGVACKMKGGDVHDMGVMLLIFLPVPYVEASSAWSFPNKRDRMLVGAAGMLVEIAIAALAFYLWLWFEPGMAKALAYDIALLASVTTVLFNGNPLLRYDGYYVASDALEIPNLAQRATRYWAHLFERHVVGRRESVSPAMAKGEAGWFFFYAPLSFVYRCVVMFSIAIFVSTQYFAVGVLMAVWSIVTSLGVPLYKSMGRLWALIVNQEAGRRGQRASLAFVLATLAFLFLLPLPQRTQVEGVLWLPDDAIVRAGQRGFVEQFQARAGSVLKEGQTVLRLREPGLANEVSAQASRRELAQVKYDAALAEDPVRAAQLAPALANESAILTRLQERESQLAIRSKVQGRLWVPASDDLQDRFYKQGQVVGYVIAPTAPRVRIIVDQADEDLIRARTRQILVKLPFDSGRVWPAKVIRAAPSATRDLPSAALGKLGGGGAVTDPRDESGRKSMLSHFEYELALPDDFPFQYIGSRASVRFEHPMEPVGFRMWRAVRRLFLGYFHA